MNDKLPIVFRALIGIGFLIFFAGGLSIRSVHSADPRSINADATLKLVKNVTNNNNGGGAADDWNLSAAAAVPNHNRNFSNAGGSGDFTLVYAEVGYTLSESSLIWTDGVEYNAGIWSCDGGILVGSVITLGAGEAVTCSITNDDIPPSLTLTKLVTNDDGGAAVPADWTLTATGTTTISGPGGATSDGSFVAGTYTLSESVGPTGYTPGTWSCTGDGNQVGNEITLAVGETATCTISSNDVAPELTIVKNPTNDSGLTALPDDFNLTVGGVGITSGDSNTYLANTPYAINETLVAGYRFVTITGDTKCPESLGGTIIMAPGDVITCTITNNDIGINISPLSGLATSENGLPTASFNVVLDATPTADVSIALSSSDTSEGTIDKSLLTFTGANWYLPQTVTITGVDDFIADGDQLYHILTGPITSADTEYAALDPPDVSVTNSDNDTPGYTITPNTDLWTSEGGASLKIQILLKSRPTSQVLLSFSSTDEAEGKVAPPSILIDPVAWPQTAPNEITITGIDDCEYDGNIAYSVNITATSTDPNYNGPVASLQVTNYEAPTIEWVEPVGTNGIYISDGFSPIHLKVINQCGEPISKVRFYRWVTSIGDHITIGEDLSPPYEEDLNPLELESGWNQVFAFAFSPPNTIQTFSEHKPILILKDFDHLLHLPLIYKKP